MRLARQARTSAFQSDRSALQQATKDHTAVAVGKVLEIMMRTHLTAINSIVLAHSLLNERVSSLRLYGCATSPIDDINSVPHQTWVVNYGSTGMLLQHHLSQQTHYIVTLNEVALRDQRKQRS